MNQLGNKLRSTFSLRIPNRSVPVQDRRTVGIGIQIALQMRPVTLSGDDVRNAVAIQVRKRHGVEFGESDVARVLGREIAHNRVLDKRDGPVLIPLLLEPRQAPSVSRERGDDVIQTVAVYVVDAHLCAAAAEANRMKFPGSLW